MNSPPKPRKPRRKKPQGPVYVTSAVLDKPKVAGEPHRVGYVRVSTTDQNNQRQVDELVKYGVAAVNIFSDTASGKNMDRPGWAKCWRELEAGDELVVLSIDRLGRNLEEVIKIERALTKKGVTLKVLAMDINTGTAAGRLIFNLLLSVAQFEREWARERIRRGIARAKERGVVMGKAVQKSDAEVEEAVERYGTNQAAKHLGYSKVTVIRRMEKIRAARAAKEAT